MKKKAKTPEANLMDRWLGGEDKKKDEYFICKDCGRGVRKKSVTRKLVGLQLCPQCYTARAMGKKEEER